MLVVDGVPRNGAERTVRIGRPEQRVASLPLTGVVLTVLTSAAEVLLATDHDPFARRTLRTSLVRGWVADGATAWLGDRHAGQPYLSALGAPPAVGSLIEQLLPELSTGLRLTVPRGTAAHLPAWVAMERTDWDFRWLDAPPPPQPGEDRVELLDDPTAVAALLAAASPTASTQPGDDGVRDWFGVQDDRRLAACAADTSWHDTGGHLSSIAVRRDARGRGLGSAVTAALTRRLLGAGAELVSLGMYADNVAGRALYDGLGFHDYHRFSSGALQVRSRW